jgi:hypothetical protein
MSRFALLCALAGCGCPSSPYEIGPNIGAIAPALYEIEALTCTFASLVGKDGSSLRVRYDERGCNSGQFKTSAGDCGCPTVYIIDPACHTEAYFGVRLAVHELIHAFGYYEHDDESEYPGSVMLPTVPAGEWHIPAHHLQRIEERFCK